jgi:hypothetical protein
MPNYEDDLQEAIDAVISHESIAEAAKFLGVPRTTLRDRYYKALRQGIVPGNLPEEENIDLSDTSTLYDANGNLKLQWVKNKNTKQKQEILFQEAAKVFASKLQPINEIKQVKRNLNEDLMTCFPVGDHHLGLLVWGEETRTRDYDLKIGEDLLLSAFSYLLNLSTSKYATIVFLGDFLHYDGFENVTPTNRNLLDSDTRYPLMVRSALRITRQMIESAAKTHEKVHVVVEIGNHDLSSSIFLMECLANIYSDNPRITVDTNPGHYHYFQHGKCLIGIHHGHGSMAKLKDLPGIMAVDVPEMWGKTEFRYIWTGHVHHDRVFDHKGCKVESFRILPPDDAWGYNNGYRSMSEMKSVVLDKNFGEIVRYTTNPSLLEAHRA